MKKIIKWFVLPIIILFIPVLSFAQTNAVETFDLEGAISKSQAGNQQSKAALSELIHSKKILNYPKTPKQEKDAALLLSYLMPLAEQGDLQAQIDLGLVYMFGSIVPADSQAAFQWLNLALENKSSSQNNKLRARAQSFLAYLYLSGQGVQRDIDKAFELLKAAEKYNDPDALFGLGSYYMHQSYVDYNNEQGHFKTAFGYFQKAAALGHPSAYYEMSVMYEYGRSVKQDHSIATELLKKSVELGSIKGLERSAYWHSLKHEKEESIKEYMILANMGIRDAMFELGVNYAYGYGGQKDDAESFKWFAKASEIHGYMSDYWLGLAYYKGQGVAKDYDQAFKLFLGDAYRGNRLAMEYVGKMYIYEEASVKKDVPLGCAFIYIAHQKNIKSLQREISDYKHSKKRILRKFDDSEKKELWGCYSYTNRHQNLDEITKMMDELQDKIKQTNVQENYQEKMWYQIY